ncbi:hypothetical protein NDU88_008219 [Pleurodeles waltl]|uniref:Secreted protein n=1 Tax=Pleurodeles waltl TaxID=8319 RepID=A0AAV7QMX1_PLEWA|nr:hypothetical protein NDU88_008219 [Pleurodeles waltl]
MFALLRSENSALRVLRSLIVLSLSGNRPRGFLISNGSQPLPTPRGGIYEQQCLELIIPQTPPSFAKRMSKARRF